MAPPAREQNIGEDAMCACSLLGPVSKRRIKAGLRFQHGHELY